MRREEGKGNSTNSCVDLPQNRYFFRKFCVWKILVCCLLANFMSGQI